MCLSIGGYTCSTGDSGVREHVHMTRVRCVERGDNYLMVGDPWSVIMKHSSKMPSLNGMLGMGKACRARSVFLSLVVAHVYYTQRDKAPVKSLPSHFPSPRFFSSR